MGRIRRWLKEPGSGLIVPAIVILALFAIFIVKSFREKDLREEAEAYRHQLIAFCAAVDHANIPGVDVYVMKDPYELLPLNSKEKPIVLVVFKKDEPFRRLYAVYSNGRVIYSGRSSDNSDIKGNEDWGNHPKFSKIGEK